MATPRMVRPLARLLISLILFAAVHGLHSPMWKLHRLLRGYYYWKGMQSALGSLSAWERLAQAAPPEPAICPRNRNRADV